MSATARNSTPTPSARLPSPLGEIRCLNEPLHRDHKSGEGFHDHRKEFRVPDAARVAACGS